MGKLRFIQLIIVSSLLLMQNLNAQELEFVDIYENTIDDPHIIGEFSENFSFTDETGDIEGGRKMLYMQRSNFHQFRFHKLTLKNDMDISIHAELWGNCVGAFALYDTNKNEIHSEGRNQHFNVLKKDFALKAGVYYIGLEVGGNIAYTYLNIEGTVNGALDLKFEYDDSGNQINRKLNVISKSAKSVKVATPEIIVERNFIFYPNPTQGQLRVEIDNINDIKSCTVMVTSMVGGRVAYRNSKLSSIYDIDISNQQNGIYILNINIDGIMSSWKILKK